MHPYKNPDLSVSERTQDLLSRMTLAEKAGQLIQLAAVEGLDKCINQMGVGSLLHINGEEANKAIDMAAQTRLGIPLLIGEDCIHGHSFFPRATIFPTQLAMAASWNTQLIEEAARVTAREVSCTGIRWTFSPVLCLTRDLRWGRVGETFGEDPYLIETFALAMIRGYQGKGLDDPHGILATAKHYAGYSETQGGRDATEADISRRKLKSYFLPPFEAAAKNGCMSFMTGYQSMEGMPSTANRWLLKETLKEEWGFEGILVTDWNNVGALVTGQKICANFAEAAALAIKSGNDMIMATKEFLEGAQEAVAQGLLLESEIDEVVYRVLALKFRMGLFENPGKADAAAQKILIGADGHQDCNVRMARESLILLQNKDQFLPFDAKTTRKILLVGANADEQHGQLGDWAGGSGQVGWIKDGHPQECTTTVLDGLKKRCPHDWKLEYLATASPKKDDDLSDLPKAIDAAKNCDVIVAVVGDNREYFGECRSTATLELQGGQIKMLEAMAQTGKPMVVVLVHSKPQVLPQCIHDCAAIIEAFNPGMKGGQAIAELIFGDFNPSGRLTISVPYHVGQQPIYYSQVRGQHGGSYADLTQSPHFAFGEGLGYTSFKYGIPQVSAAVLKKDQTLSCSVEVSNTGTRAGEEVVQLYISDLVTSATWVNKELKAFAKIHLEPGETKTVNLEVPYARLSIVNAHGDRVVEPGEFEALIGHSSRPSDLQAVKFMVSF